MSNDPTKALLEFFKEENEKSRAHEHDMALMQMQTLQMMMMAPGHGPPGINSTQNLPQPPSHNFQAMGNLPNSGNIRGNSSSHSSWVQ